MKIEKQAFGEMEDGRLAHLYTLNNDKKVEARITNFGGIVVSLKAPDRDGVMDDIVLGYDTLEEYLKDVYYFGCIVGRYANRIAKGRFSLHGIEYVLAQNSDRHHLHGGYRGFNKVLWDAVGIEGGDGVGLALTYLSRDGEEGFPGNMAVRVLYFLTNDDELRIEYTATTDRDTVVNLTHHSYFNLASANVGDILGHVLMIDADRFTPVDSSLIPIGELKKVKGTPLDFTKPTEIGARIDLDYEQLRFGGGYDHNWVLNKDVGSLSLASTVYEPTTGRYMEVYTTEPGVQFYSGNYLVGVIGKGGRVYNRRGGFCLETQHFPDSPNQTRFPSTVLEAGDTYTQTTIYRFSTR